MHLPVPQTIQSFIPSSNNHTLLEGVFSVTGILNQEWRAALDVDGQDKREGAANPP